MIYKNIGNTHNDIRSKCMILMCFIHGLRISELIGLKLSDINVVNRRIYIRRLKNGFSTIHPLHPKEIILLNQWIEIRESAYGNNTPWLFVSRTGRQLTRQQFYRTLKRLGKAAGLCLDIHPHMLRHACGFELAEQGIDTRLIQDYLGHRNIRHTVHYTASNAARFSSLWRSEQNNSKQKVKTSFMTW